MGKRILNFGTAVGVPDGNDIEWRAVLDDDTLGANVSTNFHVELTRPAGSGDVAAPGVTVFVFKVGPVEVDGGVVADAIVHPLEDSETQTADFHVAMDPTPGPYILFGVIVWPDPTPGPPNFAFRAFTVF